MGIDFPPPSTADEHGRVATGGDLEPETLLRAYRLSLFPMRISTGELTWFSPEPRGILPLEQLKVSDSLRRSRKRFEIRIDTAFEQVISACAAVHKEEYDWITDDVQEAYVRLHRLGHAHSVEAWRDGELAGGLYGIAIGGFFAGESMFHRLPDASKAALVGLVELMCDGMDDRLIDIQWLTPHLASLGAIEIARDEYIERLERALTLPLPPAFADGRPRTGS